jgi:D-hydroxyproline dehydrogenase subunit gamma
MIRIKINGIEVSIAEGTTVAAAILESGADAFRTSVTGEPRSALCGMGICFECRVTIDGVPHARSCTAMARDGMEVVTGD